MSKEIQTYFNKKGIQVEYTIPYSPMQNGVSERMNRTIMEKVRCMLLSAGLPKMLWSEALMAANFLINRSPTRSLRNKVPAELWFDEKQDVSKIRVFGCKAFLRIPDEKINDKLDSRSIKCYMVGYCPNGYRLWCPVRKKIFRSRDVIFDEESFAFEKCNNETYKQNEKYKQNTGAYFPPISNEDKKKQLGAKRRGDRRCNKS